jgi:hypothetical protein
VLDELGARPGHRVDEASLLVNLGGDDTLARNGNAVVVQLVRREVEREQAPPAIGGAPMQVLTIVAKMRSEVGAATPGMKRGVDLAVSDGASLAGEEALDSLDRAHGAGGGLGAAERDLLVETMRAQSEQDAAREGREATPVAGGEGLRDGERPGHQGGT